MTERKCDECDEKGVIEFEGRYLCLRHRSDAIRKSDPGLARSVFIKKNKHLLGGILAISVSLILTLLFVVKT